jgi:hypothetical protein
MASQTRMISYTLRDEEGVEKSYQLYYDSADITTIAEADTLAGEYAALINAVSGLVVVGAKIEWDLTVPDGGAADAGYSHQDGVTFSFIDSFEVGASFYVPGILSANIVGEEVNVGTTGMQNLINAALGLGTTEPLSQRGSGALFDTFVGAARASRKP